MYIIQCITFLELLHFYWNYIFLLPTTSQDLTSTKKIKWTSAINVMSSYWMLYFFWLAMDQVYRSSHCQRVSSSMKGKGSSEINGCDQWWIMRPFHAQTDLMWPGRILPVRRKCAAEVVGLVTLSDKALDCHGNTNHKWARLTRSWPFIMCLSKPPLPYPNINPAHQKQLSPLSAFCAGR